MKVHLINAPPLTPQKGGEITSLYPPLGLLYLVSYTRQFYPDIKWKVSDGALDGYQKCVEDFNRFKPDLVGISFTTPFATGAYKLINTIKEDNPYIPVICGGPHPSALPNEVFERSKANVAVIGEGERSFLNIIDDHIRGKVRDEQRTVGSQPIKILDTIPFPARDVVDIKKYSGYFLNEAKPETTILSSRGCPYNCWFCSNPVWKAYKPWYRMRSPKNIVDEIQFLHEKYGIQEFFDECDEFNVNLKLSTQTCEEILRRDLDIRWKVQLRCDKISEELVMKMARSGCWLVFLGIESGNQETLDGIGKRITLKQVEKACHLFKKYNIKTFGLFMTFNIWEENGKLRYEGIEESLNTLSYAKKLMKQRLLDYISWSITTPFPASPLWNTCMKFSLITDKYVGKWELWNTSWGLVTRLPNISEKDWMKVKYEGSKLQVYSFLRRLNEVNVRTLRLLVERGVKMLTLWWKTR